MRKALRLLHVEDSSGDAALIERILVKTGYTVQSERVVNAAGMRAALAKQSWDLVIADYRLPEFDAPAALAVLHEAGQDIPFIVVSGGIGEELAVALMKAGAQDYVLKHQLARLGPAVERELRDATIRHERERAELALREREEQLRTQREALERQTELLHDRETMLREIHHRVKNNMQVMSSLLSLQSRSASDAVTKRMLEENQNRIQSMALLHEILYQSDDLAMVDFPKYLRRMADHLFRSYGVDSRQIRLRTELEPVSLALDDALPCGLLTSEVISNSLKHAFPGEREGEVQIKLRRRSANEVMLALCDTGVGIPEGIDWANSRSLGLRLIRAWAQQLRGKLEVESKNGTDVKLTFEAKRRDVPEPQGLETYGAEPRGSKPNVSKDDARSAAAPASSAS